MIPTLYIRIPLNQKVYKNKLDSLVMKNEMKGNGKM